MRFKCNESDKVPRSMGALYYSDCSRQLPRQPWDFCLVFLIQPSVVLCQAASPPLSLPFRPTIGSSQFLGPLLPHLVDLAPRRKSLPRIHFENSRYWLLRVTHAIHHEFQGMPKSLSGGCFQHATEVLEYFLRSTNNRGYHLASVCDRHFQRTSFLTRLSWRDDKEKSEATGTTSK